MVQAKRKSDIAPQAAPAAELGRLRTGSRPTIYEVAEMAGVSAITVSRALNGGSCSPSTRERVQAAARRLDYQPNPAAQALAARRRKRPLRREGRADAAMPQVWQSYAEMMVRLMRPKG